jgi:hypothetical protein
MVDARLEIMEDASCKEVLVGVVASETRVDQGESDLSWGGEGMEGIRWEWSGSGRKQRISSWKGSLVDGISGEFESRCDKKKEGWKVSQNTIGPT